MPESGKEQFKYPQTEGSEKCGLIVWTPNPLKSAFFFLFWEFWTMLHQGTPVAAEGQHSWVGLPRNVTVPVHRLLTSSARSNVLPSVQRMVMSSTGASEVRQKIGTSRSLWEILEFLVDLFRTADLFPEPADSPRVTYLWFCFQTAPTFSRLYSWHRKSWHMTQWNIALNTNCLTVPSSSGEQGISSSNHKLHWDTPSPSFSISSLPQAPASK